MDERNIFTLVLLMVIFFVPSILAIVRRHKNAAFVTALNALLLVKPTYEQLTMRGIMVDYTLLPTAGAWLVILLWALLGRRRDNILHTHAAADSRPETIKQPGNTHNRHLPKNLNELDKLARQIRKSLKESEKES